MRPRHLLPLVLAVLGAAGWSIAAHPWGWAAGIGVHPYPGPQTPWEYQLWSGFIPALSVLTLLGSAVSLYRVHTCHQDRCWRLGKHRVDGTPWCTRHHVRARQASGGPALADVTARLDKIISLLEGAGGTRRGMRWH